VRLPKQVQPLQVLGEREEVSLLLKEP